MIRKTKDDKYTTINSFYGNYKYPCYDVTKSTVPMSPYISSKDVICDHKFSLTKAEYKSIIHCYLKYIKIYLLRGNIFKMPFFTGTFEIRKYKSRYIDWQESKKKKKLVLKYNSHTEGYKPIFKWIKKSRFCRLYTKHFWKIRLSRTFRKEIGEYINEDFTRIYNYKNITTNEFYKSKDIVDNITKNSEKRRNRS